MITILRNVRLNTTYTTHTHTVMATIQRPRNSYMYILFAFTTPIYIFKIDIMMMLMKNGDDHDGRIINLKLIKRKLNENKNKTRK